MNEAAQQIIKHTQATTANITKTLRTHGALDEKRIAILWHLHHKRYMTTRHLHNLIYADCAKVTVHKAVDALRKQGLLVTTPYSMGRGKGYQESLHHISKRGFTYLAHNGLLEADTRFVDGHTMTLANYAHRVACVDVWTHLEREPAVGDDGTFTLVDFIPEWRNKNALAMRTLNEATQRTVTIQPDATFVLRHNKTGKELLFFIEVDMKTERVLGKSNSLFDRLYRYQLVFMDKAFQKIGRDFQHFTSARMLFITTDAQRVKRIQEKTHVDANLVDSFLCTTFAEVDKHGLIHGRYMKIGVEGLFKINSMPFS